MVFKKRFTNEAIADINDYVYNALDNGNKCIRIFEDLRKAFDTVEHKSLYINWKLQD